jgi:hypothetical protein
MMHASVKQFHVCIDYRMQCQHVGTPDEVIEKDIRESVAKFQRSLLNSYGGNMKTCPTCCNSIYSPYRQYDAAGKVTAGCVDDCHSGLFTPISESSRWHNRPEAKKIRKALARGKAGKGYV